MLLVHNPTMAQSIYDLSYVNPQGETVELNQFRGKPLLIVNTASKCGLAPQFDGLQKLHQQYAEAGLVVLGFPSDQFQNQEPLVDSEIEQACKVNFGVTFPLAKKSDVNGGGTNEVFKFLKGRTRSLFGSKIKWNFTKFLVQPDGVSVKRFAPTTPPAQIEKYIKASV
jgi:glutathione peroxidase